MTGSLQRFPRPNLAVDIAVLTVVDGRLAVVVQRDETGTPALPGRFLRPDRTVKQAVGEVLDLKLGLSPARVHPHLVGVFSEPGRDPRGWTVSVGHAVALPAADLSTVVGDLAPVGPDGLLEGPRDGLGDGLVDGVEHLRFDHDEILRSSVEQLRRRYEDRPDPDHLLRPPYTLSELRAVHEAVLGRRLMRDSFNRRVEPLLEPRTDPHGKPVTKVGGGRPARLFSAPTDAPAASFGWRLPSAEPAGRDD